MRLAYLTTHFPFGHDETFFQPEVRSLAQRVDRLFVIPVRPRRAKSAFGDLGSIDLYLPAYGWLTWYLAVGEFLAQPRLVWQTLGQVVRAHSRLAARLKNILLFPKALAMVNVLRRLEVDHIHAQWITTSATVAYIASRILRIPWSCTAHQHDIFFDNMVREKVADASFVRVISRRNAEHLIERAELGARHRTHVVHLGVEVPPTYTQRVEPGAVRLICAARFDPSKGHRYLVDALALLKARGIHFHCDFAGRGRLLPHVREQIREIGLTDEITLRGMVHHDQLVAEMCRGDYDIAVLASTERPGEHEGIPVALMEAMAAGMPCVATATGSNDELIDATCGILVPQRNSQALADALQRLATDPEHRRTMGLRARKRVETAFETNQTTDELLTLLAAVG